MRKSSRPMMILAIIAMFALFLPLTVSFAQTDCSLDNEVERISGADRYATSAKLATECYDNPENVVIATGENFADALAASTLASAYEAPILLVKKGSLPLSVENALEDLAPDKAFIIGGTGAVSTAVQDDISEVGDGISIQRISGSDRYATSAEIANEVEEEVGSIGTVVVATGENFPDALSASAMAAHELMPILLVRKNEVPSTIEDVIDDLDPDLALVIGGTAVISDDTEDDLGIDTERISGSNRYATSEEVREYGIDNFGMDDTTLWIASGTNYPDALVAGPVAGSSEENAPIMLVNSCTPADPTVRNFFEDFGEDLDDIVIIGGVSAICDAMENFAEDAMDGIIDDGTSGSGNDHELTITDLDIDQGDGSSFDVFVHVEDEDDDDVEDASVTLKIFVDEGSGFGSDVCDDVVSAGDCDDDTDNDGDASFTNIDLSDPEFADADEVKIQVKATKSNHDSDTDSDEFVPLPIPIP